MEVVKHDGPGRLGVIRLDPPVQTPALAGIDFTISPFNSFFYPKNYSEYDFNLAPAIPLSYYTPDEVIKKAIKRILEVDYSKFNTFYFPALKRDKYYGEFFKIIEENEFEAIYIGNSKVMVRDYRGFVNTIRALREKFPNAVLITDLEPFLYPLAVYLGIDAFDVRSLKIYEFEGLAFTQFSPIIWDSQGDPLEFARRMIKLIKIAIEENKLRYLVENFLPTAMNVGILRIADREHMDYLEKYTPISDRTVVFISDHSMTRPEVFRWRSRVIERFKPPEDIELLLILPCSAKKPYSRSRSHTLYRKAVKEALGDKSYRIHELIVTSPYGVVPREWEWLAKYDIVVTGHWSESEIKFAGELLAEVLEKYPDIPIIAHVEGGYKEAVKMAMEITGRDVIFTAVGDSTTSKDSLSRLTKVLSEYDLRDVDKAYRRYRFYENVRKVFDYYFGLGAGEAILPENAQIIGSKMLRVIVNNVQTGTFQEGTISVTPAGMQRVYDSLKSYWVEVDFEIRGDVFAAGVESADERIRPGDFVGVVRDGKVVAVGKAVLSGSEMVRARKGIAIKVKKRAKG
ncbi:archaeosine synthase subunit alpha [Pyrococcus sp. ST04]|uniref:archaeosine synthase subunit alpha n=1 Tax=Pyrococcus sp. ST04 TaxID=1183377 RepID=UPI0002605994|nr:archaeosine synthase subunit alpha [Pyrococcus sp. ST04]AFK21829.1 putative Queuine tRNA-ribosyltransferase [Pyrococcus sp. ST04]